MSWLGSGVPPGIQRQGGFTLIELLIVVAIIGILSSILIPNLLSARERARVSNTKASLKTVGGALEQWAVDRIYYPRVLAHLADPALAYSGDRPYLPAIPRDGWHRLLEYPDPGDQASSVQVISRGRDGLTGGSGFDSDVTLAMPLGTIEP